MSKKHLLAAAVCVGLIFTLGLVDTTLGQLDEDVQIHTWYEGCASLDQIGEAMQIYTSDEELDFELNDNSDYVICPADSYGYSYKIWTSPSAPGTYTITATTTWSDDWYPPAPHEQTASYPFLVEEGYKGGSGCDFIRDYPENNYASFNIDIRQQDAEATGSITVGPGREVYVAGSDCGLGDNFHGHFYVTWFAGVKVDITEPNENDVFLHGDKVTFKAETKPSVTVDSWEWEILEGEGSPSSSSTDTYDPIVLNEDEDYDTPDTFKVRVTATINGHPYREERSIEVVYPKITEINFSSTKPIIHEGDWVTHDPEWTEAETDESVSVFTRSTDIICTAKFQIVKALTSSTSVSQLYADAAAIVRADPDCKSDPTAFSVSGTETSVPMKSVVAFYNDIYAYDGSNPRRRIGYEWFYQMPYTSDRYYINPEQSINIHHVYVTLALPQVGQAYETLLHITCKAADGRSSESSAVKKIWTEFKDLVIRRIDGTQLVYWGPAATAWRPPAPPWPFTTQGLLEHADGRCGAWGSMFHDCLATHGIGGSITSGIQPLHKSPTLRRRTFLVKNWNMKPSPPVPLRGIRGQGNPDPLSEFSNHCVVRYNGKIYDPSYGKTRSGLLSWEDKSLDGFSYLDTSSFPYVVVYAKDAKKVLETEIFP